MKKKKIKCGKRCGNLSLPFEIDCLDKLGLEFAKSGAVADLIRQKSAMYEQIKAALPKELRAVLSKYDDNDNHISAEQQKFFFKRGCVSSMRMARRVFGGKSNIRLDVRIV